MLTILLSSSSSSLLILLLLHSFTMWPCILFLTNFELFQVAPDFHGFYGLKPTYVSKTITRVKPLTCMVLLVKQEVRFSQLTAGRLWWTTAIVWLGAKGAKGGVPLLISSASHSFSSSSSHIVMQRILLCL